MGFDAQGLANINLGTSIFSKLWNMSSQDSAYSSQLEYLDKQRELSEQQYEMEKSSILFQAKQEADWIRHNAGMENVQGKIESNALKRSENYLRKRAEAVISAGALEELKFRESGAQLQGEQRAAIGGSGFSSESASFVDLMSQSITAIELDAGKMRYNNMLQAYGIDVQAFEAAQSREALDIESSYMKMDSEYRANMALLSGEAKAVYAKLGLSDRLAGISQQKFAVSSERSAAKTANIAELANQLSTSFFVDYGAKSKPPIKVKDHRTYTSRGYEPNAKNPGL